MVYPAFARFSKGIGHGVIEHTFPSNAFIATATAGVAWYAHEAGIGFAPEFINPWLRDSMGFFAGTAAIPVITPKLSRMAATYMSVGAACATSLTLNLIAKYLFCIKSDENKKEHAPNFPFISSTQSVKVPFFQTQAPMPSFKSVVEPPPKVVTQEIETQTEEIIPEPIKVEAQIQTDQAQAIVEPQIQVDEVHIEIIDPIEIDKEAQEEPLVSDSPAEPPITATATPEYVEPTVNQETNTENSKAKETPQPAHPLLKKLATGCFWSCLPNDLED
jgi:hypothetical protein